MPKRVDANQAEIVQALLRVGCSVQSTADVGNGFPDLVVGYRGQNYLLEVKAKKGKLRESQAIFHQLWGGQVAVVRNVDEAFKVMGIDYE